MGGRGSYAKGNSVPDTYETIDYIEGVPVLKGLNGKHSLPEESKSSKAYIKLEKDGTFREMRIYDENHYIKYEIAYHVEPNLTGNRHDKVLHIHEYRRDDFINRPVRLLTNEEFQKYKKYFVGLKFDK